MKFGVVTDVSTVLVIIQVSSGLKQSHILIFSKYVHVQFSGSTHSQMGTATNGHPTHATCYYAGTIWMSEVHAHYSHLAQPKDQSLWRSPRGDFPPSHFWKKFWRSQGCLETSVRDRWENHSLPAKGPGVLVSDIKVVHTGLAVSKGCVQKQIGKGYAYSCFFLEVFQTWSHCTYIMVLHDQFQSQSRMQINIATCQKIMQCLLLSVNSRDQLIKTYTVCKVLPLYFHTGWFSGGGGGKARNMVACKGCMQASVHLPGLCRC